MRLGQARSAKYKVVVARQAVGSVHAGADHRTYRASGPICADQIACLDANFCIGCGVAIDDSHPVRRLLRRQELAVEPNAHARNILGSVSQHLFQCVLRYPLRVFRVQRIAIRRTVKRVFESGQWVAAESCDEDHIGRIVDPERRARGKLLRKTPTAQMFPSAHVSGLRARRTPDPLMSLEDDARHAAQSEFDCQRQAHGARSDDHHRGSITA